MATSLFAFSCYSLLRRGSLMNALRAAHAIALHLLLVVRVGVHHVFEEFDAVLLCEGHIRVRLDCVEDAERLCVHRLDVKLPGFSCCGHRRGHGGWGGHGVQHGRLGALEVRLPAMPGTTRLRVNVNGPLYYVGQ